MASTDIIRQKIKSKISAIKKINDNPQSLVNNTYDAYKDDLSSTNGVVKKSINSFTSKLKGATQNKKSIFEEVTTTIEDVLGINKNNNVIDPKEKPIIKRRLLKYAKDAAQTALKSSKNIMVDETKKAFFAGVGNCDPNATLNTVSIDLSPKNFDFVNVLKIDPDSVSGKMVYENVSGSTLNGIKFNRELFNNFDSGTPYDFESKNTNQLFTMQWDSSMQVYHISGLTPTAKVSDFLNDYYNSIEYPDIESVIKNAMLMVFQGDENDPASFKNGQSFLDRLSTKLCSLCGNPKSDQPLLNNATDELSDDEVDIQDYFDFDDVEGIDLDDEDARKRRVLKFRDCNNFELPINSNHMEDFSYLLDKKTLDENVNNTINKAVSDAYEQAGLTIPFDLLQISMMGSYIFKIPKALIGSILSPKMIFPIAVSYKLLNPTKDDISVKDLFKTLCKLFYNVIAKHFWNFIKEFWKFIKNDLLNFLKQTAINIIKNKLLKIKAIITSLINILKRILTINIGSCTEIFNIILQTINAALNRSIKLPVPGLLLVLSESLPGFSSDRAYIDAVERLESSGINMGPLYGTDNKFPSVVKGIIEAYSGEMDSNAFVKVGLKPTVVPAGPGGAVISPLVEGVGKIF
jgi:hypothetical protein